MIRRYPVFRFAVPHGHDIRDVCLGEQLVTGLRHTHDSQRRVFAYLAQPFQTEPTLARILAR